MFIAIAILGICIALIYLPITLLRQLVEANTSTETDKEELIAERLDDEVEY